MKTSLAPLTLALGALLAASACSKNPNSDSPANQAIAATKQAALQVKAATEDTWQHVKDFTWQQRANFADTMDRADHEMDEKIAQMKAATPDGMSPGAKERQEAIRDYDEARTNLDDSLESLKNATSDGWAAAKERVDEAWKRVRADYDKAAS
ncbi:MAG TPA: hypothetical protein VGG34_15885 [Opitutaceae bacterium]|jgi:hypothetical protein